MRTFDEALQLVLQNVRAAEPERVPIIEATGRVLAEEVAAPWNLPLCDNSAMDGYAVRAVDAVEGARLRLTGYLPAGSLQQFTVESGCAVKIMTGAPIPGNCDAIVPVENASEDGDVVTVRATASLRQHIRPAGSDVRSREVVLSNGAVLRPAEVSMLASCGFASVAVHRVPRVAVLSTGDELVEPGESMVAGKVMNSNGPAIAAAVREAGCAPVSLGIARDTRESHLEKIRKGLEADVLVTSAGVSAGNRDLVVDVLEQLGVENVFRGVRIRPGSPVSFGLYRGKPVFSLPGNPVASLIVFEELVRPALLRMSGYLKVLRPLLKAKLAHDVRGKAGNTRFLRVRLQPTEDGTLLASSAGNQNTGILKTLVNADALAILPADRENFEAGELVSVHVLSESALMRE